MTIDQNLPGIDMSRPHPARRYNYWLGGKDNYAADRESGDEIAKRWPHIVPEGRRHDYLTYLGVHPNWQGRGLGGQLLDHRHRQLDADGMPAYLEATAERNLALYRRHGYLPNRPYRVGADGPYLFPMRRPARAVIGIPTGQSGAAQ